MAASCGDGFVWSGQEDCDDQNNSNTDGCDTSCNFAQLIYEINFAELINQASDCSNGTNRYNDCGATWWGYDWDDSAPYAPAGVTMELNHGIECGTTGKTPTLNGTNAGNFSLLGGNCVCTPTEQVNTWVLNNAAVADYNQGGQNSFRILASGCEGLSVNAGWGNDVYARVILTP